MKGPIISIKMATNLPSQVFGWNVITILEHVGYLWFVRKLEKCCF